MSNYLEILDITADEQRNDLVPLYEKREIAENVLFSKLNEYWASVKLLPLDFLQKVKVTKTERYGGVFGVVKNIYDVSYLIQDGDKKKERKKKNEQITYYESIYSGYGNIPDNVLDVIKEPSEHSWAENGVSKIGYLTQKRADIITKDIHVIRSAPTAIIEKLKSKLDDYSRYEGAWKYVDESAVVNRVTSEGTPIYCKLNISYVEWEYNDFHGVAYYNPVSDTFFSPGLPEDIGLVSHFKKVSFWEGVLEIISFVLMFGSIGYPIWLGVKTDIKWYFCILIGIGLFLLAGGVMLLGTDIEGIKERSLEKKRLQLSKLLTK